MSLREKIWGIIGGLVLLLVPVAVIIRISCFSYVENYEMGYQFDSVKGETVPLVNKDGSLKRGYIYANPLIFVYTIDLRPMQVTINANNRVLNAKLVQFNPKGFKTFVEWHGNANYSQEGLKDILMSYAYDSDSKNYDFLTIKKELKNESNADTTSVKTISETNKVKSDTISK